MRYIIFKIFQCFGNTNVCYKSKVYKILLRYEIFYEWIIFYVQVV
jgi:hypothetical protein